MSHRKSLSRRYAGRVILFSLVGWALLARSDEDEKGLAELEAAGALPRVHEPVFEFDFGSLAMNCDETGAHIPVDFEDVRGDREHKPLVVVPEFSFEEPVAVTTAKRPRRRLATTLVFATLFFAGAAFSAGAGDVIVQAVESDAPAVAEVTSTDGETTTAAEESAPAEETASTETGETVVSDGEPAEEPTPVEEPAAEGAPTEGPPSRSRRPHSPSPTNLASRPQARMATPPQRLARSRTLLQVPRSSSRPRRPRPSAQLPTRKPRRSEPVPPSGCTGRFRIRRPRPAAWRPGSLRCSPTRHEPHTLTGLLVLGVLRARGEDGRRPASRSEVHALVGQLAKLGARKNEWSAVLALEGRTAFADRSIALAHYDRAIGLRALVTGLQAAKPALQRRVLADSRLDIYPGGRSDIASGQIDVRVLVVLRYLAEANGQVSVSSLHSGHGTFARPGVVSAHMYGLAVDVSALGHTSIVGHQEVGSVTERAVRDLLLLPAEMQPRQVISLIGMGGPSFALANHDDHIHIGF